MTRATEISGEAICLRLSGEAGAALPPTAATSAPLFDAIRSCVSDLPLRRPNRTRPIDATGAGDGKADAK